MSNLNEYLQRGVDKNLNLIYGPNSDTKRRPEGYEVINKISFGIYRKEKWIDIFKMPFPDLIDTLYLNENGLVCYKDRKKFRNRCFSKDKEIIIQNIYYDRLDRRLDIVLKCANKDHTGLINADLEVAKTKDFKQEVYLYGLFNE